MKRLQILTIILYRRRKVKAKPDVTETPCPACGSPMRTPGSFENTIIMRSDTKREDEDEKAPFRGVSR